MDMLENLEYAPALFAIGNVLFSSLLFKTTHQADWISFGIAIFHLLLPMGYINKRVFGGGEDFRDWVSSVAYDKARLKFRTDYDLMNPVTAAKARQEWIEFMLGKLFSNRVVAHNCLANEKNEYRKREIFDLRENMSRTRTDTFMQVSAYATSAARELKTIFEPYYDDVMSRANKLFDPQQSGPLYVSTTQTNRSMGIEMAKSIAIKSPRGNQDLGVSILSIPLNSSQMIISNRLAAPPYPVGSNAPGPNPAARVGLSPNNKVYSRNENKLTSQR
jgi:hypothetical protein